MRGTDSGGCRPERWESLPETVQGIPSVYGHLSTFIAGPHGCIGYRFSIAEWVDSLHFARIADLIFVA
jgi:cytochrome P450